MGCIEAIWIKRMARGPMDATTRATLVPGRGIAGNANQRGKRQVTLIDRGRWDELMALFGSSASPAARRANVLLSGLDLSGSRGRLLRLGAAQLRVLGATRPCERMDEVINGLQTAMRERWGGGAFAEVVEGGAICVGDPASWE